MRTTVVFCLLACALSLSCQRGRHKDAGSTAVQREMKKQKFVKLAPWEISLEAERVCLMLLRADSSPRDSLLRLYKAHIRRVAVQDSAKATKLDRQLLEAYRYELKQGAVLKNNLQKTPEKNWVLTHPILDSKGRLSALEHAIVPQKELILNFEKEKR
ncbi:MAG: hypothetical protein MI784_02190 [Cytophagales bacterium]|nr:hypothetical protein [Cytophagales bacterium]